MQKFKHGDHVQVAKDLGPTMRHFTGDCEAIVISSYRDQFGHGPHKDYTIHLKGGGRVSWYHECQLELIEASRTDLLGQWETDKRNNEALKSDLDWIFSHGEEVLEAAHGATVDALAKCFGLTNLWGSRGEGLCYYSNALKTLGMAKPFLQAGDKDGWLVHCKAITA